MGQFGLLDSLQRTLSSEHLGVQVRICGVNDQSQSAYNGNLPSFVVLPWLQDTSQDNVWTAWKVTWRDVFVLDAQNRKIAVYNLTQHDLHTSANFDSLAHLLRNAAGPPG